MLLAVALCVRAVSSADAPATQPDRKAESHEHPTSGQLAFPGAEGYGRFARGGRGGKVYEVTTLQDYKSDKDPAKSEPVIHGSLREAIESEGSRTKAEVDLREHERTRVNEQNPHGTSSRTFGEPAA